MAMIATPSTNQSLTGPLGHPSDAAAQPTGQPPATGLPCDLETAIARQRAAFEAERPPQTHIESVLLNLTAWHAGALEVAQAAEVSVMRVAAERSADVGTLLGIGDADAQGISAMNAEAVGNVLQYTRAHERGLLAVVHALQKLPADPVLLVKETLFKNEDDCIDYLGRWQLTQPWRCPSCGSSNRTWLKRRVKFQCCCKKQHSIRLGTIFFDSPKPLMVWIEVAKHVIATPDVTVSQLVGNIPVVRRATIARMIAAVRSTRGREDQGQLLAGLDVVVYKRLRQLYAPHS